MYTKGIQMKDTLGQINREVGGEGTHILNAEVVRPLTTCPWEDGNEASRQHAWTPRGRERWQYSSNKKKENQPYTTEKMCHVQDMKANVHQ